MIIANDNLQIRPLKNETQGYYLKPLPSHLIPFSSDEGKQIFKEALMSNGLDGYFPLAEQYHTQSEPTYCGISSLVMVLNALQVDPGRIWKGNWRWYSEELADCCNQLEMIRAEGVTLEQLSSLARCNGLKADFFHACENSIESFRISVRNMSAGVHRQQVIASYSRSVVGQTGSGHFSPIGGYHEGRDLVLIMDVARFKYPAHWIDLKSLWQAMMTVDKLADKNRDYLVLRKVD